jgi:hypothetical protein
MGKLRTYHTGLLSWDWNLFPPAPYKGKGWIIDYEKTKNCKKGVTHYEGKLINDKEVTIYAHNFNSALNALELINCAILLESGEPPMFEIETVIPKDKKELDEIYAFGPPSPQTASASSFPLACMIAAKASHRRLYKYALAKFGFASRLHSILQVDIDPSYATDHLGISPYILNHVRFAYAIIVAYSVIEEIGLEIRASASNPSTINGKWNPNVKNDLQRRLKTVGIKQKETWSWDLRGKPTRVEKSKQIPSKGKCKWARGPYIRDCELEIIDAINTASYLRSKISSHKMNPIVSSLTSYDVENVRMLARRLLLGVLGFWPLKKYRIMNR